MADTAASAFSLVKSACAATAVTKSALFMMVSLDMVVNSGLLF
jgi:hypothetical protein